jgi:hypothetical protein
MVKRTIWRSIVAMAAILAGGLVGSPANAAPAPAAVAPAAVEIRSGWFGIEAPDATWTCLDSNAKGQVYSNPCQVPGNKYQDWTWTEYELTSPYSGGYYVYSIKDQATGRCLDSNANGQVYTNPCQAPGNAYQDWYWQKGSVFSYVSFMDAATSLHLYFNTSGGAGTDGSWYSLLLIQNS